MVVVVYIAVDGCNILPTYIAAIIIHTYIASIFDSVTIHWRALFLLMDEH